MIMNNDIKDLIKWVVAGGALFGGGGHIKEATFFILEPLLVETRKIRINQERMIFDDFIQMHQTDGKTLEESRDLAHDEFYKKDLENDHLEWGN